jgi:TRAP-type C4-dicarboxylate transport system permease small subunit
MEAGVNLEEKSKLSSFFSIIENLSEFTGLITSIALVGAGIVLTYEVLVRYIFRIPTIWEIEFSIYLLMMVTFVGSAYGLKHKAHINIEVITIMLPPRAKNFLDMITSVLSLIFVIIIAWKGWIMWWKAYDMGWRSESLWGPPLWIPYLFIPVGMTLLILQYIVYINNIFRAITSQTQEGG